MTTLPSIFVAHGAPPLLDDRAWMAELARWAASMPRPKSILMMSAHWERAPLAVGATKPIPLIYDFSGFPRRFYEMTYPSPGAPELAARVAELVPIERDESRGLDHGVYTPLMAMYPNADVPVLQLSLPTEDPRALVALGRKLAPLRDEGVLVAGSGFIVHNLRAIDPSRKEMPAWGRDFDAWVADKLARRDVDTLVRYRELAPGVDMSLPSDEHFLPLFFAVGASIDRNEPVTFPIDGVWFGGFTKRSVQLGV
ncbi:MAG TPA: class III extradiol ring-cleavage dioxygenase [Polyangiaceae bacterium]|jgi:4,5-DOPA dioxygenase extradiol